MIVDCESLGRAQVFDLLHHVVRHCCGGVGHVVARRADDGYRQLEQVGRVRELHGAGDAQPTAKLHDIDCLFRYEREMIAKAAQVLAGGHGGAHVLADEF